jgi:hypothetical protein
MAASWSQEPESEAVEEMRKRMLRGEIGVDCSMIRVTLRRFGTVYWIGRPGHNQRVEWFANSETWQGTIEHAVERWPTVSGSTGRNS